MGFIEFARHDLGREPLASDFRFTHTERIQFFAELITTPARNPSELELAIDALVEAISECWKECKEGRSTMSSGDLAELIGETRDSLMRSLTLYVGEKALEASAAAIDLSLQDLMTQLIRCDDDADHGRCDPLVKWVLQEEAMHRERESKKHACRDQLRRYLFIHRGLVHGRSINSSRAREVLRLSESELQRKTRFSFVQLAEILNLSLEDFQSLQTDSPSLLALDALRLYTGFVDASLQSPIPTEQQANQSQATGGPGPINLHKLGVDSRWKLVEEKRRRQF